LHQPFGVGPCQLTVIREIQCQKWVFSVPISLFLVPKK
jgi:hypothetical protein